MRRKKEKGGDKNGEFGMKALLMGTIILLPRCSGSGILPEPLLVQLQELKNFPCRVLSGNRKRSAFQDTHHVELSRYRSRFWCCLQRLDIDTHN